MRLKLAWALLILLAIAAVYGFDHEKLREEVMWHPAGKRAFLIFALAYGAIAGAIVLRWPTKVAPAAALAALAWALWWTGPLAPLAVLYFLGSCYCLGRLLCPNTQGVLATLIGAAIWMMLLWTAIHFPINYWWTYAPAFAIPYLLYRPRFESPTLPTTRTEAAALALLLFVLSAQFLSALKPEISSDGLSMHMALPAWVDFHHLWPFDHHTMIWALMPSGGDALYTGVYLLAGGMASKLLNFSFLALTCAVAVRIALRWGSPAKAYLAVALFASTPLVVLVTSSLLIENVWCALIAAAVLALLQSDGDQEMTPLPATILAGAALSVKLIAAAFAAPILLLALWRARGQWWRVVATAALLGLPVYAFSYARTGNPVFPFLNMVFKSPDYYNFENFVDLHYFHLGPTWKTGYELTFQSSTWVEGQGGAAGFHYFLLLLPAALLIRRRDQAGALTVAAFGALAVTLGAPNMRYMYAAMPLASLAIVWTPWTFLAPALIALNLWFFPASSYYDQEFALFKKAGIPAYLEFKAPALALIDRLNREAPGEPAAIFSTDVITGFHGIAYLDSWHSEHFWEKARNQPDPAGIAHYLRELGVRNIIAPYPPTGPFEVVQKFVDQWMDYVPESQVGSLALYRLRDTEAPPPKIVHPLPPGTHDDRAPDMEYSGVWLHDDQFRQANGRTLSYSEQTGGKLTFPFEGTAITYIYTRALNRGVAEVWIDGALAQSIDQYSAETAWQSSTRIAGLATGKHTFELRVTGNKNAQSSGTHVDLDAVRIE